MADCKYVEPINGDQCIGDSLQIINDNFASLEKGICDVASTPIEINIEAGDALEVEKSQTGVNAVNIALNLTNSVQYIPPNNMAVNIRGDNADYTIRKSEATLVGETYRSVIYLGKQNPPATPTMPAITIETTAMGSTPPMLTIFWMTSADSTITVYNTNSNYIAPKVIHPSDAVGDIYINHDVMTMLRWDQNNLCIGGYFWYAGHKGWNTLSEGPASYRTPSFGFANINLGQDGGKFHTNLTTASGNIYGHYGRLSSLVTHPGTTTTERVLNGEWSSVGRGWGGFYTYEPSIRWNKGRVRKLRQLTLGENSYLAVAGGFGGGGNSGLRAGTYGLTIFNISVPTDPPKEFRLNGWVYDVLQVDNYVYVCGQFSKGNPTEVGVDIPLPCIFRVNLNNLSLTPDNWIDTTFVDNFRGSLAAGAPTSRPGYGPSSFIYTLAVDPSHQYLYCGGRHYKDVTQNKTIYRKNFGLTIHEIGTDARAGTYVDWECVFNLGGWDKSLGWTNYVMKIYVSTTTSNTTQPNKLETVMYVGGGGFSTVSTNKIKLPNLKKYQKGYHTANRAGLVAFSLETYNEDGLTTYHSTPQDPALIRDYKVNIGPVPRGATQHVRDIMTIDSDSEKPLYISGAFRSVNGSACSNIVAIKKPQTQEIGPAVVFPWYPKINGPVFQMLDINGNPEDLANVDIDVPKESLLICGQFTSVQGKPKYRLARISTPDNAQRTQPPQTFLLEVAGESMDTGSNFAVNRDYTMVSVTTAAPIDTFMKTTFLPFSKGFETTNRGDLCRMVVTRPSSVSVVLSTDDQGDVTETFYDTYNSKVVILGASLDWNTETVDIETINAEHIKIPVSPEPLS